MVAGIEKKTTPTVAIPYPYTPFVSIHQNTYFYHINVFAMHVSSIDRFLPPISCKKSGYQQTLLCTYIYHILCQLPNDTNRMPPAEGWGPEHYGTCWRGFRVRRPFIRRITQPRTAWWSDRPGVPGCAGRQEWGFWGPQ